MHSDPSLDAWFHPMRALFASVLQAPRLYLIDIPATDVFSIRFVVVTVGLL